MQDNVGNMFYSEETIRDFHTHRSALLSRTALSWKAWGALIWGGWSLVFLGVQDAWIDVPGPDRLDIHLLSMLQVLAIKDRAT